MRGAPPADFDRIEYLSIMGVDDWNNVGMRHSIAWVIQQGVQILGRYAQALRERRRRLRGRRHLRRGLRVETPLIARESETTFPGRCVTGEGAAELRGAIRRLVTIIGDPGQR